MQGERAIANCDKDVWVVPFVCVRPCPMTFALLICLFVPYLCRHGSTHHAHAALSQVHYIVGLNELHQYRNISCYPVNDVGWAGWVIRCGGIVWWDWLGDEVSSFGERAFATSTKPLARWYFNAGMRGEQKVEIHATVDNFLFTLGSLFCIVHFLCALSFSPRTGLDVVTMGNVSEN